MPIARRQLLRGIGAGGLAAGLSLLPGCGSERSGGPTTLRWWSPQSAPEQVASYREQISAFEGRNPNVRIVFEPTSDEGYPTQFAAAFAAGQMPDLVTHLPSFAAQNYYDRGLIEPMDDVVAAIGADQFFPGALAPFRAADGHYCAVGIGSTAVDMLWYRQDLLQLAGIDHAPRTWDELRTACARVQRRGLYGTALPYGMNSMTSLIFVSIIHQAGGQVFTPDLDVAIDTPPTYAALDFYRGMREFCPPGATIFSWGDCLTAFVSGASATGIYSGRVLANVAAQNPRIADVIDCVAYPTLSRAIPSWTFNDFPSLFIPKGSRNPALAKAFAISLFSPDIYTAQLRATPGHILPTLKGIVDDPVYLADPLIGKYQREIAMMAKHAANGHNLGMESPTHHPNLRAGEIIASNCIAELVQRVVLEGEPPRQAVGRAADTLERLMSA
ncbi:ABC transporter substrate-binding protein [Sphingomonas flavalba]|uniref:ABC transporter substrate-binding protein n=1 Tax=Sphingomonas flavalba TaxID=2559804 RepID=UPI0039E0DE58